MTIRPALFDTVDDGDSGRHAPQIQPWKRVALDPDYAGAWTVTGDIDGDGAVEIVCARNVNRDDVHHTSSVAAHSLDGRVLWTWGDARTGRRGLHHDVACQIHDWDGDGRNEVILCAKGFLVELDGATGAERRRLAIPEQATDCVVFADLSGRGWASDVLIKDRYTRIWAFDHGGHPLWSIASPGGFPTAHQPFPVDVDRDGRDEIMAGYALLNPDGRVRWAMEHEAKFRGGGHLDCCRVLRTGATPRDWRLVFTCCAHQRLMVVDGLGDTQWEIAGQHFESIDIGRVCPERPGPQIVVDIVPPAMGKTNNPLWILDEEGVLLGRIMADYTRFHTLVDWNGDGCDEIVLPHGRGLFDARGRRVGTFDMPSQGDFYGGRPPEEGEIGNIVLRGDMDGDGVPDISITAPDATYVFRNEKGHDAPSRAPLGCGPNFSLY
jgi:hypothetical protein